MRRYSGRNISNSILIILVCIILCTITPIQNSISINIPINSKMETNILQSTSNVIGSWTEELGNIDNVYIKDNYAFVSGGDIILVIIDISNKSMPKIIGSYDNNYTYTTCIHLIDNESLALGYGSRGFEIIDITIISNPVQISNYTGIYAGDIISIGNYLYVADYSADINTFDISDKNNPLYLDSFLSGQAGGYGFYLRDDMLFIVSGSDDLTVYNVSNPISPELVSIYDLFGFSSFDLSIDGNTAFILGSYNKVAILDITDVNNINSIANLTGPDYDAIFAKDNVLYIAGRFMGLTLYNYTNTSNITEISNSNLINHPTDIFYQNESLFISDWTDGLVILDITNITCIKLIDKFGSVNPRELSVFDNIALIIDFSNSLHILDISDSSNPVKVSEIFEKTSKLTSAVIDNNHLYITYENLGLYIYDISNSTNPIFRSNFYDGGNSSAVIVEQDIAYLADGSDGFEIIDVQDKFLPVEIGNTTTIVAVDLYIYGGYAFVYNSNNGINIICTEETNDYSLGEIVGTYINGNELSDFKVSGDYLYIVYDDVDVINIENKANPYYSHKYATATVKEICDTRGNSMIYWSDLTIQLVQTYTEAIFRVEDYIVSYNQIIDLDMKLDNICFITSDDTYSFYIIELDNDKDRLNDILEIIVYLTSIFSSDSDFDGLIDGDEIIYNTNPNLPDSDFDGLTDGEEVHYHQTDPLDDDTDDDGYSDRDEVRMGSDPLDPNSVPFTDLWIVYVVVVIVFLTIGTFLVLRIRRRARG